VIIRWFTPILAFVGFGIAALVLIRRSIRRVRSLDLAAWQQQVANIRLIPCVQCQREGFYGARLADGDRRYWLCKFCGYYREVGKQPVQLRATAHRCANQYRVLGELYVQWVQAHEDPLICQSCNHRVSVAEASITRPIDNKSHAWWQFPQGLSTDQAIEFWRRAGQPGKGYL
jgi:hypothetical protein